MTNLVSTSRRATLIAAFLAAAISSAPAFAQAAPKVKFITTEGDFVVEVYPDKAPKTVANFLQYVKDKHYDGLIFHRVISNFMVQGGGFDTSYAQKPTRPPVVHEGQDALAKGGPRNVEGTLAMARTNDPNSATAQFFVNTENNSFLDYSPGNPGYAVFGKVAAGTEIVDKIAKVRTGNSGMHEDVPVEQIVIKSAKVVTK